MTDLAPHLQPTTEAEIEAAIRDKFLSAGFYPVKTDAAMISRGTRRRVQRGHIQTGFPDMTFLYGLPGTGLCLAVLIEVKTATGRVRPEQTERHAELSNLYGIQAHILRSPQEAVALIARVRQVAAILKGTL